MAPELDHVFVCVPAPRAHVDALVAAGFCEGSGNVHPGQGTANARFFFANAYFEVLWAVDDDELAAPAVRPTGLRERMAWEETGACPFGVAFRTPLSWPAVWDYEAPFFPAGLTLPMWNRPGVTTDPSLFHIEGQRPDVARREPLTHRGRRYEIAAVEVDCVEPPALPDEADLGCVRLLAAERHRMRVVLRGAAAADGEGAGAVVDVPGLPVEFVI